MRVESLIESALEQAGTVVAIVADPERGPGATIRYVNEAFASVVSRPRSAVQGASVSEISALISDPAVSAELLEGLAAGHSTQLDLPLLVDNTEKWLGLRLTFAEPSEQGQKHAIITGRDITGARKAAKHEADMRSLLASLFIRINAPVVIVTATGEIMMANPAFHELLGYSAEEVKGLRVEDLTPPEYAEAARAARAKQLVDGERYEMKIETLVKGRTRAPVWLTSVLLRQGDQRMRVVTLMPDISGMLARSPSFEVRKSDCGELRAVSLAAFRTAFGTAWQRIASRAMLRADQVIRRRLGQNDTVSRIDDHRFIIWFDDADRERNESILSAMVREIRLRFLTEFGEEMAEYVAATLVPRTLSSSSPPPVASPPVEPARRPTSLAGNFSDSDAPMLHWRK